MYEKIFDIVQSVDDFVWGWWMIILLLGTHLFMTIRTPEKIYHKRNPAFRVEGR